MERSARPESGRPGRHTPEGGADDMSRKIVEAGEPHVVDDLDTGSAEIASYKYPCLEKSFRGHELKLFCLDQDEAEFLYQEIFVRESYFPDPSKENVVWTYDASEDDVDICGIRPCETEIFDRAMRVPPHATVVDVGANMGFFSLYAALRLDAKKVYAVEPVPDNVELLERNVRHNSGSLLKTGSLASRIEIIKYRGIGERNGVGKFHFFEGTAAESTRWPAERKGMKTALFRAMGRDVAGGCLTWEETEFTQGVKTGRLTEDRAVGPAANGADSRFSDDVLVEESEEISEADEIYEIPVCTLSRLFQEMCLVDPVELVKIDVEGDELNVLAGIAEETWQLVRRFVIEVHDVKSVEADGPDAQRSRLPQIVHLLRANGYAVRYNQVVENSVVDGYKMYVPEELRLFILQAYRRGQRKSTSA